MERKQHEYFHRPELSSKIADRVLSERGASGIFLAAMRRTGKSTFIREDLIPALNGRGAEVIYVDLWLDKAQDPAVLIGNALKNHLRARKGMAKLAGAIESVTLAGMTINLEKIGIGEPGGQTLTDVFVALSKESRKPIVLLIDEIQHAQTSEKGAASLFALKAARDELNSSSHAGFRLVATGSNQSKLSDLVTNKDQAFFSAKLMMLPHLGNDFLRWKISKFELSAQPSEAGLSSAFKRCSFRPEVLSDALENLEFKLDLNAGNIDLELCNEIDDIVERNRIAFMQIYNNLPVIQAAVLKVMATEGAAYSAYHRSTVEKYRSQAADLSEEKLNIDASSIQYALDALREKGLIWKSGRGAYSVEDTQHIAWLTGTDEFALEIQMSRSLAATSFVSANSSATQKNEVPILNEGPK